GAPHAIRHSFGQTAQATELLADLGLSEMSHHYSLLTTHRALDATRQTTAVQILDLQGKPIARRQGSGGGAVTSSYRINRAPDETTATTTLPNAFSSEDVQARGRYVNTSVINFRGLLKQSSDCDRGIQHYIHDRAGRLRFRLDAAGAAERPNRI